MAQAGIHALVGSVTRRWNGERAGLLLGVILGNLLPDADNLLVAVATLTGGSTEGLHRTFTHSFFTAALVLVLFFLAWKITGKRMLGNLGIGLAVGIVMHILLDLLVWFDGVELLWPLPIWVNLWENISPPEWFSKLMMPLEFFFMAGYLVLLMNWARDKKSDQEYLPKLKLWIYILIGLSIIFTVLVYTMETGFMTPFGALYLIALGLVVSITIRMRKTIALVGAGS